MAEDSEAVAIKILGLVRDFEYLVFSAAAAVVFDYILTFNHEVDLIWSKPWSLMSTFYLVVRYVGAAVSLVNALSMVNMHMSNQICMAAFEFRSWGNIIYGVCLQGIMVVRVYAMYHRSRKVLWVLVITLTATTIWTVVENIIYIGIPSNFQVMVETLPGIIACGADLHEPIALAWVGIIRMFGFQILIFGLSSTAFVKHAIDMHRTLKRWKINHYMKVLIRENVLFFLLQVAVLSLYAPYSVGMVSAAYTLPVLFLWVAEPYLIGPRLVLSIREEYEQSDHIHFNTGDEIDLQVETIIHFAPVPGTPELAAEVPEQSPLLPDEAQDEIHEAELGEI